MNAAQKTKNARQWQLHLQAWRSSGLTQAEYFLHLVVQGLFAQPLQRRFPVEINEKRDLWSSDFNASGLNSETIEENGIEVFEGTHEELAGILNVDPVFTKTLCEDHAVVIFPYQRIEKSQPPNIKNAIRIIEAKCLRHLGAPGQNRHQSQYPQTSPGAGKEAG